MSQLFKTLSRGISFEMMSLPIAFSFCDSKSSLKNRKRYRWLQAPLLRHSQDHYLTSFHNQVRQIRDSTEELHESYIPDWRKYPRIFGFGFPRSTFWDKNSHIVKNLHLQAAMMEKWRREIDKTNKKRWLPLVALNFTSVGKTVGLNA